MEQKKGLVFKDGKFVVEYGMKHDGDKDGVIAAEAGAFVKIDAVEAIKELVKAQHKPSLEILIPYFQKLIKELPEYQKA